MNIQIKSQTSGTATGARRQGGPGDGIDQRYRLGIARRWPRLGAEVVLNGFGSRRRDRHVQADADRGRFGVKAGYSPADMSSRDAIEEMIAATLR